MTIEELARRQYEQACDQVNVDCGAPLPGWDMLTPARRERLIKRVEGNIEEIRHQFEVDSLLAEANSHSE